MKILKGLIILLIFFCCNTNVYAVSNPYGKTQTLYGAKTIRCTWYAWQQAYEKAGVSLPGWGNAQDWYSNAKNDGYSVGKEARPNSIVVMSSSDGYGHVGYVVSVNGDYMVTNEGGLMEMEEVYCENDPTRICEFKTIALNGDGVSEGMTRYTNADNIIGYIYLDDAPKKSNNSTVNNQNKEEVVKSNNSNLKSIELDIAGFEFDSDIYEYSLEVDYDTKIIKISAVALDDRAIVTGTGEKALNIGNNEYIIKVTAEDGSTKEYKIIIKRNEKIKSIEIPPTNQALQLQLKKDSYLPLIVPMVISGLIILISTVLIIKKLKIKK